MFSKPIEDNNENEVKIFSIINLTPDSFSDGSPSFQDLEFFKQKIIRAYTQKANVIDIGAESTRPLARVVSSDEELARLYPFLEFYKDDLVLSLDTRNAKVVKKLFQDKTLVKKIKFINNTSGMQDLAFLETCAECCFDDMRYIAMHSKGGIPPLASKDVPDDFYEKGLEYDILKFFEKTFELCQRFSISEDRLILDPGFGFAKNFNHSFELIELIPKIKAEFNTEILVGSSRKSFLRQWHSKIQELNFDRGYLTNTELDTLTAEFNKLLLGVDYFRLH